MLDIHPSNSYNCLDSLQQQTFKFVRRSQGVAKKKSTKQTAADDTNVVRIKASSTPTKKVKSSPKEPVAIKSTANVKVATKGKPVKAKKIKKPGNPKGWTRPFRAMGEYFKGAWYELRQVRWPNRRATWSMTLAVLIYSAFFIVIILLLDAGFKYLFELILGQ